MEIRGTFNTQQFANEGLKKFNEVEGFKNSILTADSYLKTIEEKGCDKEKLLANCFRTLAQTIQNKPGHSTYNSDILNGYFMGLTYFSRGMNSPIEHTLGQSLANVALFAWENTRGYDEKVHVANIFMDAIQSNGNEKEKTFTAIVKESSFAPKPSATMPFDSTYKAANLKQKAFEKLAGGLDKPMRDEILEFSHTAIREKDQVVTARAFLKALSEHGNENEKLFAKAVNDISEIDPPQNLSRAQGDALMMISKGISGPIGKALAKFGKDSWVSGVQRKEIFKEIEKYTNDKKEAVLSKAGADITTSDSWKGDDLKGDKWIKSQLKENDEYSFKDISLTVLKSILDKNSTVDGSLSTVGNLVINDRDEKTGVKNAKSRILLKAIAENGEDSQNREIAQKALEKTNAGYWHNFFNEKKDFAEYKKAFEDIFSNQVVK